MSGPAQPADADLLYLEQPPRSTVDPPTTTRPRILPFNQLTPEDFERLCVRVAGIEADAIHCQLYGVRGQAQQGIDVYARLHGSDRYLVCQCRRLREVLPQGIESAVTEFLAGTWAARTARFAYATSSSLEPTPLADEVERQAQRLALRGIAFVPWDAPTLSGLLKAEPGIVGDFFGPGWRDQFCEPPDSQGDGTEARARRIYAEYLREWVDLADLPRWDTWASNLLMADVPRLSQADYRRLRRLLEWLFRRRWVTELEPVHQAFTTFGVVLRDLLAEFDRHAEPVGDEYMTRRFYKIEEWDPDRYQRLLQEYFDYSNLIQDLVLELTRAGNWVCDAAREYVDPDFRAADPLLTVIRGPNSDYKWEYLRPEYSPEERLGEPYGGIDEFRVVRTTRDRYVGPETSRPSDNGG